MRAADGRSVLFRRKTTALAKPADFLRGPLSTKRDSPENPSIGFVVSDGHYLSARWPGDAHRFAAEFAGMLLG